MRVAPADVNGPGVTPVHRGLAWWDPDTSTLYTATGMPTSPVVVAYPMPDATPVQVGAVWKVGAVTVSSCGCSSPWKAVDTGPLQAAATPAPVDA